MKDGCELCELERLTRWHYEDSIIVVCDCLTCGTPMLIFRRHGQPTDGEVVYAQEKITELYGKRVTNIRKDARLIKSHEHWHLYFNKEQ